MEKTKREVENRLNQLRKEVPTRGFERYPSFVKSVSELPAELQSSNLSDLVNEKGIRSIIAFPPQIQHGWNYVQRQALIFTDNEIIHILSSIWPGHSPGVTSVNSSNLLVMKVTLLFLYGFLQVVAQGEHEITFINIEFNTVAWSILSQPLEQFLSSTPLRSSMDKENGIIDTNIGNALANLPYKFSNGYNLYGNLPDEELLGLVFQSVQHKRWSIFDRWAKLASTLLLLTTNYFIVMQEDAHVKLGWIISFVPRSNIQLMVNKPGQKWHELTVFLERGMQKHEFQLLLKYETTVKWAEIWSSHHGRWEDIHS